MPLNKETQPIGIHCKRFYYKNELRTIFTIRLRRKLLYFSNALQGGACGVIVIVVGNGHGDTSSNPGRD